MSVSKLAPAPASATGSLAPRPRSATGAATGVAGVIAALAAAVLLRDWLETGIVKTLAVLCITALAMLLVDLGLYRVHHNPTTGLALRPLRSLDPLRVARKLVGLWLTLGAIAAAYWLIPTYSDGFYQPFKDAALLLLPAVIVVSPLYIAFVDVRQREPDDGYAQLASLLSGHRPADWSQLKVYARGWVVKAFFIPIMFVFVHTDLVAMWSEPLLPSLDFEHIFSRLMDLFYLLDVLLAVIAYALTLRLIDNHIRSTEPTVAGWVICLFCYPPFWDGVGAKIFPYDQDGLFWGKVFAPYPWLYAAWGTAILALVFVYAWSTAAFGLRFSNLTNRGIITNGPYRWVKHPAYLSKNLSWWLISVPFIAGAGWPQALQSCLLLAGVNLTYFLRARTEERHLSMDPVYRDYRSFIASHGLFSRFAKPAGAAAVSSID